MTQRSVLLALLCLALAAVPAGATVNDIYDNGPINGTTDAWTINFGYIVSDSYVSDGSAVTRFLFGVWEFPGDTMTSVQWSITSGENSGTTFASGTASVNNGTLADSFITTNQFGYDIDVITVTGLNVNQVSGSTYWLNLQNATNSSGDPVFWDENSGAGCHGAGCPSMASESTVGTIASEAFTLEYVETTPEPGSIVLFGSGILGMTGVLRRKRF
ncbi:MAG: PEP-CTERM sorting domain-containing protein [Candidatus Korobacteraceae bacterium]